MIITKNCCHLSHINLIPISVNHKIVSTRMVQRSWELMALFLIYLFPFFSYLKHLLEVAKLSCFKYKNDLLYRNEY